MDDAEEPGPGTKAAVVLVIAGLLAGGGAWVRSTVLDARAAEGRAQSAAIAANEARREDRDRKVRAREAIEPREAHALFALRLLSVTGWSVDEARRALVQDGPASERLAGLQLPNARDRMIRKYAMGERLALRTTQDPEGPLGVRTEPADAEEARAAVDPIFRRFGRVRQALTTPGLKRTTEKARQRAAQGWHAVRSGEAVTGTGDFAATRLELVAQRWEPLVKHEPGGTIVISRADPLMTSLDDFDAFDLAVLATLATDEALVDEALRRIREE